MPWKKLLRLGNPSRRTDCRLKNVIVFLSMPETSSPFASSSSTISSNILQLDITNPWSCFRLSSTEKEKSVEHSGSSTIRNFNLWKKHWDFSTSDKQCLKFKLSRLYNGSNFHALGSCIFFYHSQTLSLPSQYSELPI